MYDMEKQGVVNFRSEMERGLAVGVDCDVATSFVVVRLGCHTSPPLSQSRYWQSKTEIVVIDGEFGVPVPERVRPRQLQRPPENL